MLSISRRGCQNGSAQTTTLASMARAAAMAMKSVRNGLGWVCLGARLIRAIVPHETRKAAVATAIESDHEARTESGVCKPPYMSNWS